MWPDHKYDDDTCKVLETDLDREPMPKPETNGHNIIAILKNLNTRHRTLSWYTSGFT